MSEQQNLAIKAQNVIKRYESFYAVNNLSFEVPINSCFGILGPNGAGKTTMMKMLYGRSTKDGGSINVLGFDPAKEALAIKYLCGVVSQDNNLDEELNVIDNLIVYSRFYGLFDKSIKQRIYKLLEFMELYEKRKARIKTLSGGMQRRLAIARALINNPKLLILDEPTIGLDPQVRHHIWDKLRQLKNQGTTILLSTHYMEEAFVLCDKVMIMDKGKAVALGPPKNLLDSNIEKFVLEVDIAAYQQLDKQRLEKQSRVEISPERVHIYSNDNAFLQELALQIKNSNYYLRQANLEDLFLKATGKGLDE